MKIRLLTAARFGGNKSRGDVVDVPAAVGQQWIALGMAERAPDADTPTVGSVGDVSLTPNRMIDGAQVREPEAAAPATVTAEPAAAAPAPEPKTPRSPAKRAPRKRAE